MSIRPATEPACSSRSSTPSIATIIDARPRDIGGFKVRRLLPSIARRAVYVVHGAIDGGVERAEPGRMLVFAPDADVRLRAELDSRVVLIGGAAIDGERHILWNFVSSSKERIERAKRDWRDGRYPKVPGDEVEFVPLPD